MTISISYQDIKTSVDVAPAGTRIELDNQWYGFDHLIINKHLTIAGTYQQLDGRPTFNSAQWGDNPTYEIKKKLTGTVLHCTAGDGIAVKVNNRATLNLENVAAFSSGGDVTGIEYQSGVNYIDYGANHRWSTVAFCNFKVGIRAYTWYQCAAEHIQLWGCDIGAILGEPKVGTVEGQGVTGCTLSDWDSSGCRIGVELRNFCNTSRMVGCTFQGYSDTALLIKYAVNATFEDLYFEAVSPANYAIDFREGSSCKFKGGKFGTPAANPEWATFEFKALAVGNEYEYYPQGMGKTIVTGGYNQLVGIGDVKALVTLYGMGSELHAFIPSTYTPPGMTPQATYIHAIYGSEDVTRRGGMAFMNLDPILVSPDGSKWRLTINNAGVESWTKVA